LSFNFPATYERLTCTTHTAETVALLVMH
jgi:hypothetical protein